MTTPRATPVPMPTALDTIAASAKGGFRKAPGISVKLSALHPRYEWSHAAEAKAAILPVVRDLALKAAAADVHFTIDAEEADRLELSMDIIEALVADDALFANGWGGFGLALQAYRSAPCRWSTGSSSWPASISRKLMVRLVKGAYWDTEIKAAQVAGLSDYPVFTRKVATDVSYLACAKRMLAAGGLHLPGLRHPQRQHHRRGQGAGRRDAVRIPAAARHGRGALRRARQARARHRRNADPGAHLRAGRKPQGIARLSRPPPARKRRQLAASSTASPTTKCRSTRWSATRSPSLRRSNPSAIRRSRCPTRSSARRARTAPGVDLSDPLVREPLVKRAAKLEAAQWTAAPTLGGGAAPCRSSRRSTPRSSVGTVAEASAGDVDRMVRAAARRAARVGRAGRRSPRRAARPRRRPVRRASRRALFAVHPRSRQNAPRRGARSARGGRFPALLRQRGAPPVHAADRRFPARPASSTSFAFMAAACSRASARGISRWRSSSDRSPPRWPRAMPRSPSRPSRRR